MEVASMAQRTEIILTDDLDGSTAEETITFGLDGTAYEIDLNKRHAAQLRKAIRPFVEAARKASNSPARRARSAARSTERPNPSQVRAWAKDQGIAVNDRGRVPEELVVRFQAAGE
jgi:hypothetical protein